MKKTIVILIIIFLAATIGLIVFHVLNSSDAGKLYDNKQIVVSQSDHSSTIYEWSEISALSEDFTAVYKRKVGPATEHTYTGVPLSELIELAGISLTEHSTVLVKSIDSFRQKRVFQMTMYILFIVWTRLSYLMNSGIICF